MFFKDIDAIYSYHSCLIDIIHFSFSIDFMEYFVILIKKCKLLMLISMKLLNSNLRSLLIARANSEDIKFPTLFRGLSVELASRTRSRIRV